MKPLTIIYWTRVLLGIAAAFICTLLSQLLGDISLFNAISIALLVYVISYYIYKAMFLTKVEKPRKIVWTGIGAYFLTWIAMFALFLTLVSPTLTVTTPAPNTVFSPGGTVTIEARITNQFGMSFSDANVTTKSPTDILIYLNETSPGTYSATYNIPSENTTGEWRIEVEALINGRYREASVPVQIQSGS